MNNNTQRSVDDLTWAQQVFEKLDDDTRHAVRLLILSERQEAEKLRQEVNELKCIRTNALKFLDTELCENHFEEAKKQSFDDFNKSQKDAGCRLCLRQENEALKNEIQNLRSYCMVTFGESHPEMRKCIHELENEALKAQVEKLNNLIQRILGDSHISDVHSVILAEGFKYDE